MMFYMMQLRFPSIKGSEVAHLSVGRLPRERPGHSAGFIVSRKLGELDPGYHTA